MRTDSQARYHAIARIAVFVATLASALVAIELLFRRIDGYRLVKLELTPVSPAPVQAPRVAPASAKWRQTYDAAEYVDRLRLATGN